MNGLGILIIGGLGVLLVLAVKFIVIPLADRPEGRHAEHSDSEDSYSWGERPPEIASEPQFHSAPPWAPAAAPLPAPPAPPPVIHHDEYGPVQEWHPEPEALAPDKAHQAALAVGALIAATNARAAAKERARAAELEAEARATRPWMDDTGTFSAICAEVA